MHAGAGQPRAALILRVLLRIPIPDVISSGRKAAPGMHEAAWRWLHVTAIPILLVLSACGGGGSGGGGEGGGGGGGSDIPPAPTLSVAQNQVSVGGQTGNAAPASINIPITIVHPSGKTLYSAVTYRGDSVAGAAVSWQSNSSGAITIAFALPAQLGAGSFSETITLNVCTDSACAHSIAGAPASIGVSYKVTGSALPPVSFYFPNPLASFTATTSDTSPETTNFTFYIKNVPPAGLYLLLTQPRGGFITNVTDTIQPDSLGELIVTLTFTLVSPASLGSGYFGSSVSVAVCYDQACTEPATGSPVTVPISYEVDLTQGVEYTLVTSSTGGLSDLAYDSANQQLYATSLAGYPPGASGAVFQFDPATGSAVNQVSISDSLATVAVSDDGSLLYAGSKANPSVYRLMLPSLQADITIPLGSEGSEQNIAAEMAVAPGEAHTLGVAFVPSTGPDLPPAIALFDDATELPQSLASLGRYASADFITWGADASTLYASQISYQAPLDQEIDILQANSSGLSIQSAFNLTGSSDTVGSIVYDSGDLYESSGVVRDATTGTVVSQIALPNPGNASPNPFSILCVTPDSTNNRIFVLTHNAQSSHLVLLIYALPNLAMQGAIDLGYDTFDVKLTTRMVLWGSQGVAFNRNGLQILSGTF